MKVDIKIVNKGRCLNPSYSNPGDAGMDIKANFDDPINSYTDIEPGETKLIKTGLFVEIPEGYELQVRSRSGLSLKEGLIVLNSPGTIDSNYRGEIGVILHNISTETKRICLGDRIAQLVLNKVPVINWINVDNIEALSNSERGEGGFGSTGK